MKKTISVILVLVMILAMSTCAFAEGKKIVFLPPAMTSPFYASCIEGAEPVAEALGYELEVLAPKSEDDYEGYKSLMEDAITSGAAGLACCCIDLEAVTAGIKDANAAGIPVVMSNIIPPRQSHSFGGYYTTYFRKRKESNREYITNCYSLTSIIFRSAAV